MRTLEINLPDNVKLEEKDVMKFLAAKLYESGKLSLGQAADIAGLSKFSFAEILADYDVSIFNYPASDIKKDAAKI
jgi:predicted HTH domain antitoxin